MGRARGGVGAKRGRGRGGGVGAALTQRDGARHHFDGVGKMDAQRLKLDQLSPPDLDQRRGVAPRFDLRPRGFRNLFASSATYE